MVINKCNQLIQWKHTHMEWVNILYGKKKKSSELIYQNELAN